MGVHEEPVRRLVWVAGGDAHWFGLRWHIHTHCTNTCTPLSLLCCESHMLCLRLSLCPSLCLLL